jgi:hypothetical protein
MILILIFIGFAVGAFGTLIGAGGGFILMPVLLLMYPNEKPEVLTAISLAIVFFNALSGSIAYMFKKRIHYRSALIFSIASAPGALLGAYTTKFIPRNQFELIFGVLMLILAIYLLFPRNESLKKLKKNDSQYPVYKLIDFEGHEYSISYNMSVGILISAVVGFISSLLGIGGGIIHVPALVNWLNFPVHIATATSHGILAVMSAIGTAEHIQAGQLSQVWDKVLYLGVGVVGGAQLGAHFSNRVKGVWIMRALALGLLSVGIRFIF